MKRNLIFAVKRDNQLLGNVMTAIVGILNKQAMAVAADSAVTVGHGIKIYNTANKIFTLSKRHPVGVAIYNNASFNNSTPWETVIKMYRSHLGDFGFATVDEYAQDLILYLKDFLQKHYDGKYLDNVLSQNVYDFWISEVVRKLPHASLSSFDIAGEDLQNLKTKVDSIVSLTEKRKVLHGVEDLSMGEFMLSIEDVLGRIKGEVEKAGGDYSEFKESIERCLFLSFTREYYIPPYHSGVAIFGYGEDEIYPSLYEYHFNGAIKGIPIVKPMRSSNISEAVSGSIHPMAQTDVISTYIEGISPQIEQTFISTMIETIRSTVDAISALVKPVNESLSKIINSIDYAPVINSFTSTIMKFKQEKVISPLIQTVACMGKEDIAELAENLIYVTSMKRHITPNLESVGGPIDVAVVSKGDGFIWMKRKHYFDPRLNNCFFDNYFYNNQNTTNT